MTAALVMLVGFLLSNMPSPVYPLWQESMGFTASTTTVLFAVYQAAVLFGLLVIGRLADRAGWRVMLVSAMAGTAVAAVLFTFALGPWWLIAGRVLSGLSIGVLASSGAAAVTEQLERRGRKSGPVVASAVTSIGLACGPLLGGLGVDLNPVPERSSFPFEVVFAVVAGAAVWVGARRRQAAEPVRGVASAVPRDIHADARARRALWSAATMIAAAGIVCAIYMSIGAGFIRNALGSTSGTLAGALVFVVFGCAFACQYLMRAAPLLVTGIVAMLASMLAAALLSVGLIVGSIAVLFVSAALSGASQGLAQMAGLAIARRVTPLRQLRRSYAWMNVASYLFGGGFVLIAGALLVAMPETAVVSIVGAGASALAIAAVAMLTRYRQAYRADDVPPTVPARPAERHSARNT